MKFQRRGVSEGSRVLAILGSIVRVVELDAVELDVDRVTLSFGSPGEPSLSFLLEEDNVDVFVSGAPWLEERRLEFKDIGVSVRVVPSNTLLRGFKLRSIYEVLPKLVISLDLGMLRELSLITTRSGIEFIALYMEDGSLVVLEGDRHRVTIPSLEALAAVHTHPDGGCGLSEADVRTAAYALADLELFEAIVTPSCTFYIARIGFLGESDFEVLLNNRGGMVDPVELDTVRAGRMALNDIGKYLMLLY
jgi:hypothetical protein